MYAQHSKPQETEWRMLRVVLYLGRQPQPRKRYPGRFWPLRKADNARMKLSVFESVPQRWCHGYARLQTSRMAFHISDSAIELELEALFTSLPLHSTQVCLFLS